jgi:hypothetical protein
MWGTLVIIAIVAFMAMKHSTKHYQTQMQAWDRAIERGVQEKMKMHQDVAKHVKNILVQEGFAVRAKEAGMPVSAPRAATANTPAQIAATPAAASNAGAQAETKKAAVVPLQEATGRVVFLGEVPEPGKGYDIFTCRLLGQDGEVEFRGAQLKGEGLRMGDLVTIRRLQSESLTQADGSTKRKNRFEVIKQDVSPALAEEPQVELVAQVAANDR